MLHPLVVFQVLRQRGGRGRSECEYPGVRFPALVHQSHQLCCCLAVMAGCGVLQGDGLEAQLGFDSPAGWGSSAVRRHLVRRRSTPYPVGNPDNSLQLSGGESSEEGVCCCGGPEMRTLLEYL